MHLLLAPDLSNIYLNMKALNAGSFAAIANVFMLLKMIAANKEDPALFDPTSIC